MAKYKVVFTVRDKYGKDKEIDGGTVDIELPTLTREEITRIEEALPLEDYLKKSEIPEELDYLATDVELENAVNAADSIRYADFELLREEDNE